jgi:hypothetical protein
MAAIIFGDLIGELGVLRIECAESGGRASTRSLTSSRDTGGPKSCSRGRMR